MLTEYEIQLCLIQAADVSPSSDLFPEAAERELSRLFPGDELREVRHKSVDEVEIVLAEIGGMNRYASEDEFIEHLLRNGSERFWEWLQGYRFVADRKDTSCGCCKAKRH
jgi:hypothetical protein